MATRNYVWRTAPTGTEGTQTVYVDSDWGSDVFGNGTRQKPYQSLTRAWQVDSRPSKIVCKGLFSEQMSNGNHSAEISGDYYGAAVFDGAGLYVIYGFTHNKMIFRNVPPGNGTETVWTGSALLAGVGREHSAAYVTNQASAGHVDGVVGSSVSLHRSALFYGYIGGTATISKVVYDSPVHNSAHFLSLAGSGSLFLSDCTVFNVAIQDRCKNANGTSVKNTVFAKFAMIGNESRKITFTRCVFAADVKWYYLSANAGNTGTVTELTLTGATSAARQESLIEQLTELGVTTTMPAFNNCIFSAQTYDQIFNDADNGDFTLKPDCDAVFDNGEYCGAMPPAIHIPILADSTGVAGSWDERSVSGCVVIDTVQETNHSYIAVDTESASTDGEIVSKIITIDPSMVQLSSVWSELVSHIGSLGVRMWKENIIGTEYEENDTLPQGIYVVKGAGQIDYGEHTVNPGATVYVTEDNTTFSLTDPEQESVLAEVTDPSIADVLYCRCRSVVYARVGVNDDLQRGATYYNDGNTNITYHNRTIAPGESFFCMIDNERFTCTDSTYKVAVMFDDTRVPASEWVPAATMQTYFVGKTGGSICVDEYGIPLSSGNPRSFGQTLSKSCMDRMYIQFSVKVKKYADINVVR